jgi:hypothetical protein
VTDYFVGQGSALTQARQQAFTWIAQQAQTQTAYLAYIDVFWALMLISAAAIPLALNLTQGEIGRTCSGRALTAFSRGKIRKVSSRTRNNAGSEIRYDAPQCLCPHARCAHGSLRALSRKRCRQVKSL